MTLNLKLNHKPDNSVAVAEMIERHVRSDVSGFVAIVDAVQRDSNLNHTDITIREMRACVADAGVTLRSADSKLRSGHTWWYWHSKSDIGGLYETEHECLTDCTARNNLDPAQYAREPKQWWAVSDWLRNRLREHGETVREFAGLNIWLRCTAGELVDDIALRSVWETAG